MAQWTERRTYVLKQMLRYGWTTEAAAKEILAKPIQLAPPPPSPKNGPAPEFVDQAERELKSQYGYAGRLGWRVTTTCDLPLQQATAAAAEAGATRIERETGKRPQVSAMVMGLRTRQVPAMVGGAPFKRGDWNRALVAKRSPGSTFKTILYAAAMRGTYDQLLTPSTLFQDHVFSYPVPGGKDWTPFNHGSATEGMVTIRTAFAHSDNTVAAQVIRIVGPDDVIMMASQLGIRSELRRQEGEELVAHPSIALGTSEVTLKEMLNAYAVFATQGNRAEPIFVQRLNDGEERQPEFLGMVSPALAFQMTSLLRSVIEDDKGTGRRAKGLGRPAAGKTGTSQDEKDAWFVGYTPDFIAAVWVGNDDGTPLGKKWTGAQAALPIWIEIMKAAHAGQAVHDFPETPEGIVIQDGEIYLEGKVPPVSDGGTDGGMDGSDMDEPPVVLPTLANHALPDSGTFPDAR